jgi:hypothetical protein
MLSVKAPSKDCILSALSTQQSTAYCGFNSLEVGQVDGHNHHSVMHFNAAAQIPRHSTIKESWVALYQKSQAGTAYGDFGLYTVTRPWNDMTFAVVWQRFERRGAAMPREGRPSAT